MSNPFDEISNRLSSLESLLEDIKKQGQNQSQKIDDQLFTIEEAAAFLRLAIQSVYGLVHRSEIPYMKKGKRLYFSKEELTEWLKKGRRKTAEEIATEAQSFINKKEKGGVR